MAMSVTAKIKQAINVNLGPGVILAVFALSTVLFYLYYFPAQPTFQYFTMGISGLAY